jgi:hypothetical protein
MIMPVGVLIQHAHTDSYTKTMADEEAGKGVEIDPSSMLTPMEMMAIALNEMFKAFIKAGFSEDQALYLVVETMGQGFHEVRERLDDEEN